MASAHAQRAGAKDWLIMILAKNTQGASTWHSYSHGQNKYSKFKKVISNTFNDIQAAHLPENKYILFE